MSFFQDMSPLNRGRITDASIAHTPRCTNLLCAAAFPTCNYVAISWLPGHWASKALMSVLQMCEQALQLINGWVKQLGGGRRWQQRQSRQWGHWLVVNLLLIKMPFKRSCRQMNFGTTFCMLFVCLFGRCAWLCVLVCVCSCCCHKLFVELAVYEKFKDSIIFAHNYVKTRSPHLKVWTSQL